MTMKGSKLALLLLLVVALEILLFTGSDANPFWWRRRRRRRRCTSFRPTGSPSWVNDWGKDFNKICPTGYSTSVWQSKYKNCFGDRIYHFECKKGPFPYENKDCSTIHHVNDYNKPLIFRCSHNGFIAGVGSTYSAYTRDRRFSFRCCHKHNYHAHTCKNEPTLNTWHAPLRFEVPKGFHLVGAFSEHSKQDRKWKFQVCAFSKRG